MGIGLYIHVPFCRQKCPYCDFYSLAGREDAVKDYALSVVRNVEHYGQRFHSPHVDTIYFGGGTPSLLPAQEYARIFEAIARHFHLHDPEISLEANPGSVSLEGLQALHAVGFNRISFGVQSLQDDELRELGRLHDRQEAMQAIQNAREAGFKNISADLMIGIIRQNLYSLEKSIRELAQLELSHVSAYLLKIEPGTPYAQQRIDTRVPDEDACADLYLRAVETLGECGFHQYEISNFCREGFACRHNLHYWRCEEYLGIGPSAHSYLGGKRFAVPRSLKDFLHEPVQPEYVTDDSPGEFSEYAMLQIRLMEGLDLDFCALKYGADKASILKNAGLLIQNGLLEHRDGRMVLTPSGCLVSNQIIGHLFV